MHYENTNRYSQILQSSSSTALCRSVVTQSEWPFSINSLGNESLSIVDKQAFRRTSDTAYSPEGLASKQYSPMDTQALSKRLEVSAVAETAPIRVLLVDEHVVLLDSLDYYLAQHARLSIVGKLCHGDQCVGSVETYRPDVVVMALSMPGLGVYERLQQLQTPVSGFVQPAVLILTSALGEYQLFELIDAGARGYLPKDTDGRQLIAAIIALAQGVLYIHGDFGAALAPRARVEPKLEGKTTDLKNDCILSQRELQLLELMAEGCSNKEIARRLFLSTGTIKSYSSRMFDKMRVRGRTQAVIHALHTRLLNPEY